MVMATLSLGGSVAMVMSFPGITGLPSVFNQIAVVMATRPEISSDIVQFKVNSNPATLMPELLIVAEMGSEGTAGHMDRCIYRQSKCAYIIDILTSDGDGPDSGGHCLIGQALISSHKAGDTGVMEAVVDWVYDQIYLLH